MNPPSPVILVFASRLKNLSGYYTRLPGKAIRSRPLTTPSSRPTTRVTNTKITPDWRRFREYFARLEKQGMGIDLASYVGATQVRRMVLGDDDYSPHRPTGPDEMNWSMRPCSDGAVGFPLLSSTHRPYAKTDEMIALARRPRNCGVYATHMRSESDAVMAAIDETLRIGRRLTFRSRYGISNSLGRPTARMPEVVGEDQRRARFRALTSPPTPTPIPHGSTVLRLHSALGARWRQCEVIERLKDPHSRPHAQRYDDPIE